MVKTPTTPNPTAPLAHHFRTLPQQFDAAKLGMWIFLVTEVLLFAGLFCAYAVYRRTHPQIFAYGHQYLDVGWGAINTIVLIFSSFTMAMAVYAAQRGHQRDLVMFLALTLLGGVDFLGIKFVEYSHKFHENLVWGAQFYVDPRPQRTQAETAVRPEPQEAAAKPAEVKAGDLNRGRDLFRTTCAACHGMRGQGIPGQGKDMRGSELIGGSSDADLFAFLKQGRMPNDPLNTTGRIMPARGGNPMLTDADLLDIIAYVREVQQRTRASASSPGAAEDSAASAGATRASSPGSAGATEEFLMPRSVIPAAATGPAGLFAPAQPQVQERQEAHGGSPPDPRHDPQSPPGLHQFFAIYFCMTGLHGLHVFAGMVVIAWLLVRAIKGHFNRAYFTPVDLGGLYWHLVDLVWIFLFPLLYLIH